MSRLILVIEDEKPIREVLIETIELEDFKAMGASSVAEAINLLKNTKFKLITLDLSLPSKSGNDFLAELPEIDPDVPVIVITATPERLEKTYPQVKLIIQKPFDIDHVIMNIKALVN